MTQSNPGARALVLFACAVAGAGLAYHLTLQSRFDAIQQQLDQDAEALQQHETSENSLLEARARAFDHLENELKGVQFAIEPLGKLTHEQAQSLWDIHQQLAKLQNLEQLQQDAARRIAGDESQMQAFRAQIQAMRVAIAEAPTSAAVDSVPEPGAIAASAAQTPPPMTDNAVDVRPVQASSPRDGGGIQPIVPTVSVSDSDQR